MAHYRNLKSGKVKERVPLKVTQVYHLDKMRGRMTRRTLKLDVFVKTKRSDCRENHPIDKNISSKEQKWSNVSDCISTPMVIALDIDRKIKLQSKSTFYEFFFKVFGKAY